MHEVQPKEFSFLHKLQAVYFDIMNHEHKQKTQTLRTGVPKGEG